MRTITPLANRTYASCLNPNYKPDDSFQCYSNGNESETKKYTTSLPISPMSNCLFKQEVPGAFGWYCPGK